jgi:hypothetical protein
MFFFRDELYVVRVVLYVVLTAFLERGSEQLYSPYKNPRNGTSYSTRTKTDI